MKQKYEEDFAQMVGLLSPFPRGATALGRELNLTIQRASFLLQRAVQENKAGTCLISTRAGQPPVRYYFSK